MRINSSIFKKYDIRGRFPEEINERAAYLVGFSFSKFLGEKEKEIVVARDNRQSSAQLKEGLVKGLVESGRTVVDIGECPTPLLYFTVGWFGAGGGIQVTGSHLPTDFNGLKVVKEEARPVGRESGLKEIEGIIQKDGLVWAGGEKGEVVKKNPLPEYVDFNLEPFEVENFAPLKVVVDTGNSSSGLVVPALFRKAGLDFVPLFSSLDRRPPQRPLNPLEEGALVPARRKVEEEGADFGVVFDGDGDRIIFLDEKGKRVPSDFMTALLASRFLSRNQDEKVVFGLNSSKIVSEVVRENGGEPVLSKVGHTNVKRKMRETGAILGGEVSGHFFLRDHYFSEVPFFVLFEVWRRMSEEKKSLSRLLDPFANRYFYSGEINFEVEKKKEVVEKLADEYEKGEVSRLDGVRVDFSRWWFNARPSRTEDLLRLVVEAETRKLLERRKEELRALIENTSRLS